MSKYKNIKSAAHNLGYSFLSDMNMVTSGKSYAFVPEEIYWTAKDAGEPTVRIDLLTAEITPTALATRNVRRAAENYVKWFPELLRSQSVDPAMVRSASLELRFDFANPGVSTMEPTLELPNVTCTVKVTDDRGVLHEAHPQHWCRE